MTYIFMMIPHIFLQEKGDKISRRKKKRGRKRPLKGNSLFSLFCIFILLLLSLFFFILMNGFLGFFFFFFGFFFFSQISICIIQMEMREEAKQAREQGIRIKPIGVSKLIGRIKIKHTG
ncbi:hypothetical protein QBC42DRAFT_32698 [Cladorrhinum samala]|uniref:Uncharacterized protein n=1 Tax=Cladorrhinum samala TaxID=585594 RepID=A0AAV9HVG1_9PEZI|nr:hypothetical protein QBC42DRAFT_32698 [Cladorrhinum samala]